MTWEWVTLILGLVWAFVVILLVMAARVPTSPPPKNDQLQ